MTYESFYAEVAELVDALGSGSSRGFPVGVRVSPSAPLKTKGLAEPYLLNPLILSFSCDLCLQTADCVGFAQTYHACFFFLVSVW